MSPRPLLWQRSLLPALVVTIWVAASLAFWQQWFSVGVLLGIIVLEVAVIRLSRRRPAARPASSSALVAVYEGPAPLCESVREQLQAQGVIAIVRSSPLDIAALMGSSFASPRNAVVMSPADCPETLRYRVAASGGPRLAPGSRGHQSDRRMLRRVGLVICCILLVVFAARALFLGSNEPLFWPNVPPSQSPGFFNP